MSSLAPRALVIGGSGTLGAAVVAALKAEGVTVLIGGRKESSDVVIDITDTKSVAAAFAGLVGDKAVNHVVVAAGDAVFKPVAYITKDDFQAAFNFKVFSQMDVAVQASKVVLDGGSITLTSGVLDRFYIPAGSIVSAVNAALNAFAKAASNELPRGVRLNVVSPGLLTESVPAYGPYMKGFAPVPAKDVAGCFVRSAFGGINGKVIEVLGATHFAEL